jgi:hypothetical protein
VNIEEAEEAIEHQQTLKNDLTKRLRVLQRQRAKIGDEFAPVYILTSIDDVQEQMQQCDDEISHLRNSMRQYMHRSASYTYYRSSSNLLRNLSLLLVAVVCVAVIYTLISRFNVASLFRNEATTPVPAANLDLRSRFIVRDPIGSTWQSGVIRITLHSVERRGEKLLFTWILQNEGSEVATLPYYFLPMSALGGNASPLDINLVCDSVGTFNACRGPHSIAVDAAQIYTTEVSYSRGALPSTRITIFVQGIQSDSSTWQVIL